MIFLFILERLGCMQKNKTIFLIMFFCNISEKIGYFDWSCIVVSVVH
jgi:hypothetical protein